MNSPVESHENRFGLDDVNLIIYQMLGLSVNESRFPWASRHQVERLEDDDVLLWTRQGPTLYLREASLLSSMFLQFWNNIVLFLPLRSGMKNTPEGRKGVLLSST